MLTSFIPLGKLLDLQILAFLEISRKAGVASRKGLDASRVNTQISDVIPAIDPLSGEFLSVPIGVEDDPECTPNPN